MLGEANYYSNYHVGYRSTRKTTFKKFIFWAAALIIVSLIALFILNLFIPSNSKSLSIISPLAENVNFEVVSVNTEPRENQQLTAIVAESVKGKNGTYAVAVLNLKTGEEYYLNKHRVFDSASLYKLWIMGYAYKKIENGLLDKNLLISDSIENLNRIFNIASESAEKNIGGISLTVKNALDQMISRSDNYSALLLSSKLGLSNVKIYLNEYGLSNSNIGTKDSNPTTTVYDTFQFLYKLYYGELANQEYTDEMLSILKKQVINQKLPKYLPDSLDISHKTGELGKFSHDAGIVYANNGPYIIVVLSETNSKNNADETIANISQEVYNYFEK
ncbi:MAG: hypothetical protein A2798_02500 [Candidatus Levybacteria bacterium RIFCSPHIGHO2_01_FULL_37_17]|nr:MAG: hypothetical protein A2798_02500 [Candidatus Levybacteria bacterium RIFCSPHIGHO2_01_FULL_37_17]OGH36739.1 MAG: hypothetical protein A2959_00490 [Candidatus Levybacteria bacterium RIFCSPLOWO2_01_FULL_38_23]